MPYLKNLTAFITITFLSVLAAAQSTNCLAPREINVKNGQSYYRVNDRARSLYMISRDLYGDSINWKKIAEWNNLSEPYKVLLGQELLIQVPARISEEEGNRVLIQAWTNLNDEVTVLKLQTCLPQPAPIVAQPDPNPTAQVQSEAIQIPALTPAPLAPEPLVETKPAAVEKQPLPPETNKKESRWNFKVEVLASNLTLENKDAALGTENLLNTKINFGAELSLLFKMNSNLSTILSASHERIEFEQADGAVIENDKLNIQGYGIKFDYNFKNPFSIGLGYRHGQRPVYRATRAGVTIDSLVIPEAFLGLKFKLAGSEESGFWLLADGIHSFSASNDNHEIKEGSGYQAGFQIEKKVGSTTFSLVPTLKVVTADSASAQDKIETYNVNLGLSW